MEGEGLARQVLPGDRRGPAGEGVPGSAEQHQRLVGDPATGAAAAALGGYLRAIGEVTEATTIRVRQGEDMGRPSDLLVAVDPADARVRVTGQAVPVVG